LTGITFHPDENLLAAINREGQCLIWKLSTGNIQKVLDPLSGKITAIAFSPRGSHLAVAHSSGAMGFRSPFSEEWIKPFKAHEQSISALVYSSDGHHLVSGSLDKTIKVWEIIETD
jgi:eukaryotic-like serine/threonine-protein kinase